MAIGATAWIAIGAAAFQIARSEQQLAHLTDALRSVDQHAREAADALADARLAQQAYVAAGQGIAFWMPRVTAGTEAAQTAITAMRDSAGVSAQPALEQAHAAVAEFANVEKRVRDYLKSGQQLMAGDVIFTEGNEAAATSIRHVEAARQAAHQAADANVAASRKQEALIAGGAGAVAALAVLLLVPVRRRAADVPRETHAALPADAVAPAPPQSVEPPAMNLKLAAALATEFGRVRDLDELRRVLARAADAMDASGIMVWMGSQGRSELRVVLAHGYPADVLAKIPPVPRSADNAAAAAYRSGSLQIVLAKPGGASGAIVAPILGADGCIGALSAEIRHRAETSEAVQALAQVAAAHLAAVLEQAPAEVPEPKTARA